IGIINMAQPAAIFLRHPSSFFILVGLLLCGSCSTIKNYPDKPFVYQSTISLDGKFSADERKDLQSKLQQQLHDSMLARSKQTLGFWSTLKNPPVYDSSNADKSVIYMRALLNSLGYYRDSISYDTTLRLVEDKARIQQRISVNFNVAPGKQMRLDSISYTFGNDTLQQITAAAQKGSLLKKGDPYATALISSELDRLTDVYRNNGYLLFSKDELLVLFDTVGLALLRPTIDPMEQAEQFAALSERRQNPKADIDIILRANKDSTRLTRYYIGNTTVYPDMNVDTATYVQRVTMENGYKIVEYKNLYEPSIFPEAIYLRRGDLYSQRNYLKTLNRFNTIGSWRLVVIDPVPRAGTDTVDFAIRLTPASKYSFNANVEGSQNIGNNVLSGNLSGNLIGVNFGLQNRNFARRGFSAATNLRFGTEVTRQTIVARQAGFGHTISFPKAIPHLSFLPQEVRENAKTILGVNASYTTRRDFFDLTNVNAFWSYNFNWKNKLLTLRLPNIEYTFLRKGDTLIALEETNQTYKYIFNSGLVTSLIANYTVTGGQKNTSNVARFGVEVSGLLSGLIRSRFLDSNLQRFIKLDAEFRQTYKIGKSAFAWRVTSGAGFQILDPRYKYNRFLPFYKSYVAGGANSMRAWALRRLGPGSTVKSFNRRIAPDRFGEMLLEANAEYRFFIADLFGFKVNSALFTDAGNVWYLRKNEVFPEGQFQFNKLWKDLAIGVGTGLRIDLGFFLIRVDYAFKMKDPSPEELSKQNKFFADKRGVVQLGVTYPF
ncbi:MAG TPA: BamA/TamA family outer membrane protein, partial [Chitinophagaceae bacterium]|nr:BamA/TamA family outer membrane protein [Chitinophagaceae bacterium]